MIVTVIFVIFLVMHIYYFLMSNLDESVALLLIDFFCTVFLLFFCE